MNVLCLDGGGSKGVYTLGVLKELEALLNKTLNDHFDVIYGTSTGSIIAAMIGLGYSIDEIKSAYFSIIPLVMKKNSAKSKSTTLKAELESFFGDKTFTDFKTGVSIVAMNYTNEKPFIFKRDVNQAYKLKNTFLPGFGCKISTAILASCAAYPIFEKVTVNTENQGEILAVDGGFIANNPTLFAITDATQSLNVPPEDVAIVSIGTGNFIEKPIGIKGWVFQNLQYVRLFAKILTANTNTTEILTKFLFKNIPIVRINDSFNQPDYGTNMVESDLKKLDILHQLGRNSFAAHEDAIKSLFKISE